VLKCLAALSTGAKFQLYRKEAIMAARSKRASARSVSPSLKCKPGDLALYISGCRAGRIVEVIKYRGTVETSDGYVLIDAWQVQHPDHEPDCAYFQEDRLMMPIRPGDLDESETDELGLREGVSHG
jgi:hypothetical protein